jgi:type II secretory pathway component PulK
MRTRRQRNRITPPRRGAALMAALVCMLVASVLAGSVLRAVVRDQRQSRERLRRTQAAWLAEAGVERAAAQLRARGDYDGETWRVPPAELGGSDSGLVEIRVENVADRSAQRRVHVQADYPDRPLHRARCGKTILIDLALKEATP